MAEYDQDYYAILGIAPDADEAAIRLAFRRLALRFHPDVAGAESAERMGQINVAYRVLSNPERRSLYDLQRGVITPAPATPPPPTEPQSAPKQEPTPKRPPLRHSVPRGGTVSVTPGPIRRVASLNHPDVTPIAALSLASAAPFLAVGLLDGRLTLWNFVAEKLVRAFAFDAAPSAGVLQDVRCSPSGAYLAAWGFQLGTRVWQAGAERPLWNAGFHGPNGVMDLQVTDAPPLSRMALPDAPISLADDDPFRWAHEGRAGSAIFARPLIGPVDPAWAVPLHCVEAPTLRERPPQTSGGWRVQRRLLSSDGARLLTVSTSASQGHATLRIASLWDLAQRTHAGVPQPRNIARLAEPLEALDFPIAATPDLTWLAASHTQLGVRVHNLSTRRSTAIPTGRMPADAEIALAPDGSTLGLASRNTLALWDARTGNPLQKWTFATEVTALSCGMSGDRACWVIGLANGSVEVWA